MKLKKILLSLTLVLIGFVVISIGQVNVSQSDNHKQEARTVEYSKIEFTNTHLYECFKGQWQTKDRRWDFSKNRIPTLVL
ncbi:MAG TPA: hypothetical protein GX708_12810 [Gallicola sp.]|nr:hypothetical protein [Gallicola sp.]